MFRVRSSETPPTWPVVSPDGVHGVFNHTCVRISWCVRWVCSTVMYRWGDRWGVVGLSLQSQHCVLSVAHFNRCVRSGWGPPVQVTQEDSGLAGLLLCNGIDCKPGTRGLTPPVCFLMGLRLSPWVPVELAA